MATGWGQTQSDSFCTYPKILEIDKNFDVLCISINRIRLHHFCVNKYLVLPAVLLLSAGSLSASQIVWSQDFEGMTPGQPPSGPGITPTQPAGSQTIVVNDFTEVADPFGPEGNHSLMMEKTETGPHVGVLYEFGSTYSSGVFTLDAYTYFENPGFTQPLLSLVFYNGTISDRTIGAWMWISDTAIHVIDGPSATVRSAFSVWTRNSAQQLQVTFTDESTFSVYIDGELISLSGETVFDYYGVDAVGADRVVIAIADSATNEARVFIDNLSLQAEPIPEPAAVALIGVMGAFTLMLMKRKRAIAR